MNLVLLYGPPAVGKLTIARELEKITGYKNFHNHLVIDLVSDIFGFDHPSRRPLEHQIRREIVEEAAKAGINLIVTGVIVNINKDLYQAMMDVYKKKGGEVCLVQLKAEREVLESRVSHPSRERKINTDAEFNNFMKEYPESVEKFGEGQHLEIDTSKTSPQEAAQQIADYYKL